MVARQFIAWDVSKRNPSRRVRCDLYRGFGHLSRTTPAYPRLNWPDHTVPPGRALISSIPGSKLPGYVHLVPPGRAVRLILARRMLGKGLPLAECDSPSLRLA
jgi:hypothetical protein